MDYILQFRATLTVFLLVNGHIPMESRKCLAPGKAAVTAASAHARDHVISTLPLVKHGLADKRQTEQGTCACTCVSVCVRGAERYSETQRGREGGTER